MPQKKISTGKTSDTGKLRRLAEAKWIENQKKTGPLLELESEAHLAEVLQYRPKLMIG
jgi:hypothetical protein